MNTSPLHISFPSQPLPHVYVMVAHWWFGSRLATFISLVALIFLVLMSCWMFFLKTKREKQAAAMVLSLPLIMVCGFIFALFTPAFTGEGNIVQGPYTSASSLSSSLFTHTETRSLASVHGQPVLDDSGNVVYQDLALSSSQSKTVNSALEQHYGLKSLNTSNVSLLKGTDNLNAQVGAAQSYTDSKGNTLSCALDVNNVKADIAARYQGFDVQHVFCSKQGLTNAQLMQQVK